MAGHRRAVAPFPGRRGPGSSACPTLASATGGAAANRGWISVTGGRQIAFLGNRFARTGTRATTATPLAYVSSAVGVGQVKWGFNTYAGYSGASAVIQQGAANRIAALPDPLLTVTTAA
ncbi:hypothetical protein [Phytohabitans kaempferiae]|uniref:Uncharacterized protein n=1 Tax=Phytohabitans kaempferiae TaxID=1620943 RepID=A0ABV6M3Z9_9ACTN